MSGINGVIPKGSTVATTATMQKITLNSGISGFDNAKTLLVPVVLLREFYNNQVNVFGKNLIFVRTDADKFMTFVTKKGYTPTCNAQGIIKLIKNVTANTKKTSKFTNLPKNSTDTPAKVKVSAEALAVLEKIDKELVLGIKNGTISDRDLPRLVRNFTDTFIKVDGKIITSYEYHRELKTKGIKRYEGSNIIF